MTPKSPLEQVREALERAKLPACRNFSGNDSHRLDACRHEIINALTLIDQCVKPEGFLCEKHQRGSNIEGAKCSECYRESLSVKPEGGEVDGLLPCPFCGCKKIDVYEDGAWVIQCWDCAARADPRQDKQKAIQAWNTRAATPQPPAVDVVDRVAKAIYDAAPQDSQEQDLDGMPLGAVYTVTYDDICESSDEHHEMLVEQAKAAIAAIQNLNTSAPCVQKEPEIESLASIQSEVSLEKCAMAAAASDYSEADYPAFEDVGLFAAQNWPMFKEITKAVLDAAGVKYEN